GTIKIVINIESNYASVHLKHSTIYKQPDRYRVNEKIKLEIQKKLHLSPSKIYKQLEQEHLDLTQKQLFEEYESILQDAIAIVQEQHATSNYRWA
ncbi:21399_t:CDS:2, partial [Gigaspora rosea]